MEEISTTSRVKAEEKFMKIAEKIRTNYCYLPQNLLFVEVSTILKERTVLNSSSWEPLPLL